MGIKMRSPNRTQYSLFMGGKEIYFGQDGLAFVKEDYVPLLLSRGFTLADEESLEKIMLGENKVGGIRGAIAKMAGPQNKNIIGESIKITPEFYFRARKPTVQIPSQIKDLSVLWFHQDSVKTAPTSGAALQDQRYMDYGIANGYNITEITKYDNTIIKDILTNRKDKYDVVMLSNTRGCEGVEKELEKFDAVRVKCHHDCCFCKWGCAMCQAWGCKTSCVTEEVKQRILGIDLNIFVSPMQMGVYEKHLGKIYNAILIPAVVEEDKFPYVEGERKGLLYVGFVHQSKGIQAAQYISRMLGMHLDIYGEMHDDAKIFMTKEHNPDFTYHGMVSRDVLRDAYQSHVAIIHCPYYRDNCPRSAMEAMLSGCGVIYNERVGTFHYDWNFADNSFIRMVNQKAPSIFWSAIEDAVIEKRMGK